jgi:hypothetical protein
MHPQYLFHAVDALYREDHERVERERRRAKQTRTHDGVRERRLRRIRSRSPAPQLPGPQAC